MRQNLAIGIANSWINLGQGFAPLIVGYLMDSSGSGGGAHGGGGEEASDVDYRESFIKINAFLCVLDTLAFVILLLWCLMQPHMLNNKE
mmetsp:Transcript_18552/g.23088  ORF Transcript_18552/g.23088 Transcript_18552/m.23088 type:complete len:89 (+) Transcript_18552:109-375(+)